MDDIVLYATELYFIMHLYSLLYFLYLECIIVYTWIVIYSLVHELNFIINMKCIGLRISGQYLEDI